MIKELHLTRDRSRRKPGRRELYRHHTQPGVADCTNMNYHATHGMERGNYFTPRKCDSDPNYNINISGGLLQTRHVPSWACR